MSTPAEEAKPAHRPRDSVSASSTTERDARRASALHALTSTSAALSSSSTPLPPVVRAASSAVLIADKATLTGSLPAFALPASSTSGAGPANEADDKKQSHAITLQPGATVHPFARVGAATGPVSLGAGAVVWEMACVGLASTPSSTSTSTSTSKRRSSSSKADERRSTSTAGGAVTLGENVSVGAHAVVRPPASVGAHSSIGVRAVLQAGVQVGAWCRVADGVVLGAGTVVADATVVYYDDVMGRNVFRRNRAVLEAWSGGDQEVAKRIGPERVKQLLAKGHDMAVESARRSVKGNLAKWTAATA